MKLSVLVKILEAMYYNSKNRTLSLCFYDDSKAGNRKDLSKHITTLEEFQDFLPDIYYQVDCAAFTKNLTVYSYDYSEEKFEVLSVQHGFDFAELRNLKIKKFALHSYTDTAQFGRGGVYKQSTEYLKYPASLFIAIFRLLGECVTFIFKSSDQFYFAHYIDGKVLVSDISEYSYALTVSTLFQLNSEFPEAEIIDFNPLPMKLNQKSLLDSVEQFCKASKIQYVKRVPRSR